MKYSAALRHQGHFQKAMSFLEDLRDGSDLEDRQFGVEYRMALAGCRDVLPMTLDEFQRKYPKFS